LKARPDDRLPVQHGEAVVAGIAIKAGKGRLERIAEICPIALVARAT